MQTPVARAPGELGHIVLRRVSQYLVLAYSVCLLEMHRSRVSLMLSVAPGEDEAMDHLQRVDTNGEDESKQTRNWDAAQQDLASCFLLPQPGLEAGLQHLSFSFVSSSMRPTSPPH